MEEENNNKHQEETIYVSHRLRDKEGLHVDYKVRNYFYDGARIKPFNNSDHTSDMLLSSHGTYTLAELLDFYDRPVNRQAYQDLKYVPPSISDELMDYSLRGLEALKV